MEFDGCTSNEAAAQQTLVALVEETPAHDAMQPSLTSPAIPRNDDATENPVLADSAKLNEGRASGNGSDKILGMLKKSRETVAAASAIAAAPAAAAPGTDTRVAYSYPELVKRCEDNKLYRAGCAVVFSLGCITSPFVFHTRRYILPFGFTSMRSFTSFVQPDSECPYICEILDGGDGKQAHFRVTCIDDVEQPIVAHSPSAAWRQVLRMIRAKALHMGISVNLSDQISGLVMFGVVHPSIQQTLRGLTGSTRCRSMDYFEHKTGYEDGIDVDTVDASCYVPDARLLFDVFDGIHLPSTVPVNNFLSELDQHVNDIIATTPQSRRASDDVPDVQLLPHNLSHEEVAHVMSVISADAQLSAAEEQVFYAILAHVRSTSSSPASFSSLNNGKHDVLCWWHMHEAACAFNGFSRSIELLRKARDELAHHHSQLVQVSHKYERSVFKNSKLEDSVSATKRELEEFKRKDAENAKAIKQGQFMAREYKRVQRELQEKSEADAAAENIIDWRLTTDELATRRRQVVLLERNVEFLRSSLERARCDALFHTGAADTHRQAMTSVRLQVASVRSVLMDAVAACDHAGVGADVRERIVTAFSMLQVDTLGELPVFKPHSTTALFVKRQRTGGSSHNCNNSAPMPWKKRVLLHMEQAQTECQDVPLAPPVASASDAVTTANACGLGGVIQEVPSREQNDEYANDVLPPSVGGADAAESMVA